MPSIPYGAFAMSKAQKRAQEAEAPRHEPKVFERKEYTPVKYNGKMMNR